MNRTPPKDDADGIDTANRSPNRLRHILLSSMGIDGPRDTPYELGGRVRCANFSSLALAQLLPETEQPDFVAFLLTPKAKRNAWGAIRVEAASLGIEVQAIELPADVEDDTRQILETAAEAIPDRSRVSFDVTQGLRYHALLCFALALNLPKCRDIEMAGIWCARLEIDGPDRAKPLIDLKPVLRLAD